MMGCKGCGVLLWEEDKEYCPSCVGFVLCVVCDNKVLIPDALKMDGGDFCCEYCYLEQYAEAKAEGVRI